MNMYNLCTVSVDHCLVYTLNKNQHHYIITCTSFMSFEFYGEFVANRILQYCTFLTSFRMPLKVRKVKDPVVRQVMLPLGAIHHGSIKDEVEVCQGCYGASCDSQVVNVCHLGNCQCLSPRKFQPETPRNCSSMQKSLLWHCYCFFGAEHFEMFHFYYVLQGAIDWTCHCGPL